MKAILIMLAFGIIFLLESYIRNNGLASEIIFLHLAWFIGGLTGILLDRHYTKQKEK